MVFSNIVWCFLGRLDQSAPFADLVALFRHAFGGNVDGLPHIGSSCKIDLAQRDLIEILKPKGEVLQEMPACAELRVDIKETPGFIIDLLAIIRVIAKQAAVVICPGGSLLE